MSRQITFTPSAAADIAAAFFWYERQKNGLGSEFEATLLAVLDRVAEHPEGAPVIDQNLRRVLVPTFPYAVYYRFTDSAIDVRGCLHHRRNPRAWRRRG